VEHLSTEETARALGLTPQTVKTRLHRARLFLRERLMSYLTTRSERTTLEG
jgi:RNA polymerase sigma-70 factor (ECF subfamily)